MTTFVTDRLTDGLTDGQTDGADYIGPAVRSSGAGPKMKSLKIGKTANILFAKIDRVPSFAVTPLPTFAF